ncbi:hypothetical protein EMA8858_01284 [Emticicia aquatica]|uniref:J domain-containing protein n=1 Tax=Emticicia aquatica TaxID=1681835 RepID=A0ABM9APF8_9BACT|nr:hypothetical protein [Emticicia aquatica]CAH0995164.1 hypothetical protein EMA8858_01284 [Emticicia aquatica]
MSELIQIKTENSAVLTKLQKQFNTSIQKINHLKKLALNMKQEIEQIQAKISTDIIPLERKLIDIQIKEIIHLDTIYQENVFKKRDNDTLSEMILERAEAYIGRFPTEELSDIFTRHNDGISYEEVVEQINSNASTNIKDSFSTMFGVEFEEEVDLSDPEKLQEYLDKQMAADEADYETRKNNRTKSAKQIEREEKKRQEEKNLNRTSRQIYMELVKEFHPDREKDELEKEKKTLLMHKISEAYEKDDLFDLLRLRLNLMGTNFENSNNDNLKYYVKLLKQQIVELENEVSELQSFGQSSFFGPSLYERFASDGFYSLENKFKKEVAAIKKAIKESERQLPFYRDFSQVKYLIDAHRQEQKYRNKRGFDINDVVAKM